MIKIEITENGNFIKSIVCFKLGLVTPNAIEYYHSDDINSLDVYFPCKGEKATITIQF